MRTTVEHVFGTNRVGVRRGKRWAYVHADYYPRLAHELCAGASDLVATGVAAAFQGGMRKKVYVTSWEGYVTPLTAETWHEAVEDLREPAWENGFFSTVVPAEEADYYVGAFCAIARINSAKTRRAKQTGPLAPSVQRKRESP